MNATTRNLRLGTRGSALALWQANWVKAALEEKHPGLFVELTLIKTTGDKILDVPLAKIGGKGLFTKEIDEALLGERVDVAVHSLKDVPFQLPDGIELAAVPLREDGRDAFVSNGPKLRDLPSNATIGTSSLRRQVQLRHHFPALNLRVLRGNVDTRLRKLEGGEFDGIVLAVAGLKRLGYEARITEILDENIMLPAVAQGALGIVCRSRDSDTQKLVSTLEDPTSRLCVTAERALLRALGGSCQVPVAGKAVLNGDLLRIEARIANLDGTQMLSESLVGPASQPAQLGLALGQKLMDAGAARILAEIAADGSDR
jgi:hydroxymethylbilane synthase